eukprot:UN23820
MQKFKSMFFEIFKIAKIKFVFFFFSCFKLTKKSCILSFLSLQKHIVTFFNLELDGPFGCLGLRPVNEYQKENKIKFRI